MSRQSFLSSSITSTRVRATDGFDVAGLFIRRQRSKGPVKFSNFYNPLTNLPTHPNNVLTRAVSVIREASAWCAGDNEREKHESKFRNPRHVAGARRDGHELVGARRRSTPTATPPAFRAARRQRPARW